MIRPTAHRPTAALRPPRLLAIAAAAVMAAACGRGANQSADRNGADTTSADTSATGPFGNPVGENKPATDSAFAKASQRLDSLSDAGVRPANGLDSAAQKGRAATRNEPGADTSRLNNRATPDGVAADGRRP